MKKLNEIKALVDLYEITSKEINTLPLDLIYNKLNTNLIYMVDLYYKPSFKKFDVLSFHKCKSKLFIICSNFLDIQQSLILEPDKYNLLNLYIKEFSIKNDTNYKLFEDIISGIINNIKNKNYYTMNNLKCYIVDKLIEIIKIQNSINLDNIKNIVQVIPNSLIPYITELEDLKMSTKDYEKSLVKIYNQVIQDYNFILNKYPEYHSRYLDIENNLLISVREIIFKGKNDFKLLYLPNNTKIIFQNYNIFENVSVRSYQKSIPLFSKNILSKVVNILKYRSYQRKDSNLKFIK